MKSSLTVLKSGIYVHEKNVKKSKGYRSMMAKVPNTITQCDKTLHAQQRRLLAHGFSDAALRAYEEPLHAQISKFCETIGDAREHSFGTAISEDNRVWSEPKDMANWCKWFLSVILRYFKSENST